MEQQKISAEASPIDSAVRNKRPYEAPRILSDEPLEVAAFLCDGQANGFGKPGDAFCVNGPGS